MYRKPGGDMGTTKYLERENNKKNQLGRKFSAIFNILMNPGYYEGTKYAEYFNRLNENGTSKIYIHDPMEVELQKMVNSTKNQMKYLVGLAGMGKTTLLRNFFRITDRDAKIDENNIIIYISFYYAALSIDSPQKSVEQILIKYLSRAIQIILKKHHSIIEDKKRFWEEFYDYIDHNKPELLMNENLSPSSDFLEDLSETISYKRKKQQLDKTCESTPIEYYSSFMKYILSKIEKPYNIILIYDDIESKAGIFHSALIEVARHMHSCFSATEDNRSVKTIVVLRAYTFRSYIERQSDARREIIEKDTLLKKNTVNLHDIFDIRFKEIEEIEKIKENAKNIQSYQDAREQLQYVEQRLDTIGSNLIYNLANYNLCNAMILYCSVMTNVEWVACDEKERNGSFRVDAQNYQLTTENILYAIANGNAKQYVSSNSNYVPNLLYNYEKETELVGLYIIRFLLQKGVTHIYGVQYAEGRDILTEIVGLFVSNEDSEARLDSWHHKVYSLLDYLYDTGILFRSLYDIEDITETQIERKYNNSYKLYLSPRGMSLYKLLSQNAVLLELYRDDIYTDILNNNKLTNQLSTYDLFEYLIAYLYELFQYEKRNINNAINNLEKYQELLGNEFICVVLLEGVVKNLGAYFREKGDIYNKMMDKVRIIRDEMIQYADALESKKCIRFSVSEYLNRI